MRIGTLFSGIGAPEQGAHRVYGDDLEMAFACEFDKFARKSFTAIYDFDGEHFHNDVNDMDGTQYRGKVDVLVGGSPCQAFSIAGLRKGTSDERGGLIYQYIRIVEEVMAPMIVYENVKGMLSIGGGRTVKEFVAALRNIGYYCHYDVINTKDYGVPQNRERIFLVGFLDHEQYYRFQFAPKQTLEKRLKDVLEDDVDEKYYLSDKLLAAICPTDNTIEIGVIGMLDIKGNDQIKRVYGTDGNAPCLQTMQGVNREPKILQTGRGFNNGGLHDECPTITKNSFECNNFVSTSHIRKLTPLECWRLQGFPDEAFHTAKEAGVSDSQLYKQAGNSMSCNVLEMIFRQIEATKKPSEGLLF